MKPLQCSHCGKAIFTGFLCSDCQTLRAYQPQLFADSYVGTSQVLGVNRSAILAVGGVLAVFVLAAIFFPSAKKLVASHNSTGPETATSVANQFKQKFDVTKYTNELPASNPSEAAPQSYSPPPVYTPPPRPLPPPQPVYTPPQPPTYSAPPIYPRTNFVAVPDNSMSGQGSYSGAAHSTINQFLQDYCVSRYQSTGQSVSVVSISWFPNGSGAAVGISDGGQYTQGTAQFAPGIGWSWMVSP